MTTLEQAEREWRRFEDGPTPFTSAAYLRRFVGPGDRGLDVGCRLRLCRWRELRELLEPHGEIVAATATGIFHARPPEPELRDLLERLELDLGAEPGALETGQHILAVVRLS